MLLRSCVTTASLSALASLLSIMRPWDSICDFQKHAPGAPDFPKVWVRGRLKSFCFLLSSVHFSARIYCTKRFCGGKNLKNMGPDDLITSGALPLLAFLGSGCHLPPNRHFCNVCCPHLFVDLVRLSRTLMSLHSRRHGPLTGAQGCLTIGLILFSQPLFSICESRIMIAPGHL